MNRILIAAAAALLLAPVLAVPPAAARPAGDTPAEERQKAVELAQKAAKAFDEIMGAPDDVIPEDLLKRADTIAVFPDVLKGAFIFGGTGGKGLVSSRDPKTGRWSPPVYLSIGGASWGAQIGVEQSDFILIGVNPKSRKVFDKGEWTLKADASVAAGPIGRKASAGTDIKLNSEFLSYSRAKGLFAGISLEGAKIKHDTERNAAVYGPGAALPHVLMGHIKANEESAGILVYPESLAKYSAHVAHK
jgi:SH3 domain-containing YSC84-like protein 1